MHLTPQQARDKDFILKLAETATQTPVRTIQQLNGLISYNYDINHDTILKLPSYRSSPQRWVEQARYLPILQRKLTYQVPIPNIREIQIPQGKITASVYSKIQGNTILRHAFMQRPLSQKITFFEELSDASAQLHHVLPDSLPVQLSTVTDLAATYLCPNIPDGQQIIKEKIIQTFQKEDIHFETNHLLHLDLHPGNVVLNSQNHIVGILDWDSLGLGDTFMEFHRPNYSQKDLDLLRQIYQQRTSSSPHEKATRCIDCLYKQIMKLFALGSLTHHPTNVPGHNIISHRQNTTSPSNLERD